MASKIGAEVVAVPVGPDSLSSVAPYGSSAPTNTHFNQIVAVPSNYQSHPIPAYSSATVIPMQVNAVPIQPMQIQADNRSPFIQPVMVQYGGYSNSGGNDPVLNWTTDLFQCGDCCPCLYSWFCPCCALGVFLVVLLCFLIPFFLR
jgi:hypothetical protein